MVAVDPSAVARIVGIETDFKDLRGANIRLLPQRIAIIGQPNDGVIGGFPNPLLFKRQITSAAEAGETYGFGSPIHQAALQLFPANGDGVGSVPVTVYPVVEFEEAPNELPKIIQYTGAGVATETAVVNISVSNFLSVDVRVEEGEAWADIGQRLADAVNANVNMPVAAAWDGVGETLDLTAKYSGYTSNLLWSRVIGEIDGLTFAIDGVFQDGFGTLDLQLAFDQFQDTWETIVINAAFGFIDADVVPEPVINVTSLDEMQAFGESRWNPAINKPFVSIYSFVTEVLGFSKIESASIITQDRNDDRINCQITLPCCFLSPFTIQSQDTNPVIAASAARRIAQIANANPPVDYAGQKLESTFVAPDFFQYTYIERDGIVKGGASPTEVLDGVNVLSDTITPYSPQGEEPPAFRYVVDIMKVMNIIYNLDLIFDSENWRGKVLVPDDTVTENGEARKPKDAKAAVASMIDGLAAAAIVVDPDFAKQSIIAQIDSQNPKRLNLSVTNKLSGNTNIISIQNDFGFFFG